MIKKGFDRIRPADYATILLGDTDVGKSTLANLLAGIPLKMNEVSGNIVIDVDE